MPLAFRALPNVPSPKPIPEAYVYEGLIYLVGRGVSPTYVPSVEVFDPGTEEWLPGPYAYVETGGGWEQHATGVGSNIYCFPSGRTYKYDIVADAWTNLGVNHSFLFSFGAFCAAGTDIFCFAGLSVKKFDTTNATYSTLGTWPNSREGAVARLHSDGFIYVMGGGSGSTIAQKYDPDSDTWTTLSPLATEEHDNCCGEILDGNFYVIGGSVAAGDYTGRVDVYNVDADAWSYGPATLGYKSDAASVLHDGRIFVFGGEGGDTESEFWARGSEVMEEFVFVPAEDAGVGAIPLRQRQHQ